MAGAYQQPLNVAVGALIFGLFMLFLDDKVTSLSMEAAFNCSLPARLVSEETSVAASTCSCKMGCLVRPNCTAVSIFNYRASPITCQFSTQIFGDEILIYDSSSITFLVSDKATTISEPAYARSCLPRPLTASPDVSVPTTSGPSFESTALSPFPDAAFTFTSSSAGSLPTSGAETCGAPYVHVEGVGCLQFVNKLKPYLEARQHCLQTTGDLFIAKDEGHFQRMTQYLHEVKYGQNLWVGVEYQKWLNGRAVSPWEWSSVLAGSNSRSCAVVAPFAKYKLLSYTCTIKFCFLCQKTDYVM